MIFGNCRLVRQIISMNYQPAWRIIIPCEADNHCFCKSDTGGEYCCRCGVRNTHHQ